MSIDRVIRITKRAVGISRPLTLPPIASTSRIRRVDTVRREVVTTLGVGMAGVAV